MLFVSVLLLLQISLAHVVLDDGTEITTSHYSRTAFASAPIENLTVYLGPIRYCDYSAFPTPAEGENAALAFYDVTGSVHCGFPQEWAEKAQELGYKVVMRFAKAAQKDWSTYIARVFWVRNSDTIPVVVVNTEVPPEHLLQFDDSDNLAVPSIWLLFASVGFISYAILGGFVKGYATIVRLRERFHDKMNPSIVFLWLEVASSTLYVCGFITVVSPFSFPVLQWFLYLGTLLFNCSTFVVSIFLEHVLMEAGLLERSRAAKYRDLAVFAVAILSGLVYTISTAFAISGSSSITGFYYLGAAVFQIYMAWNFVFVKNKVYTILNSEPSASRDRERKVLKNLYISGALMFLYCLFFILVGVFSLLGSYYFTLFTLLSALMLSLSQLFQVFSIPRAAAAPTASK